MNNFIKCLILIICICFIIKLSLKFKEKFFQPLTIDSTDKPNEKKHIDFLLSTNKNQNKITITFKNEDKYKKYFIIFYINNDGPYLTKIDSNDTKKTLDYTYENILKEVLYKFSVIGIDDNKELSNYIIKQIKLSLFENINSRAYSFDTKISCNPNGEHLLSSKCLEHTFPKLDSNEYNYDLNINENFNEKDHEELINNLNNENKEIINFV